jgi:hypothetical protein
LVHTKKLRKVKMQLLPESGEHVWPDPAKIAGFRQETSGPGQIRPDPVILAGSRQDQWPDPAGSVSGSGHIRPDSDHFGQIRPGQRPDPGRISGRIRSDQAGFRPVSVHGQIPPAFGAVAGCRRIPAAGSIPVVGFRHRHYSSDLMMPDSGAAYFRTTNYCRIRTVKY